MDAFLLFRHSAWSFLLPPNLVRPCQLLQYLITTAIHRNYWLLYCIISRDITSSHSENKSPSNCGMTGIGYATLHAKPSPPKPILVNTQYTVEYHVRISKPDPPSPQEVKTFKSDRDPPWSFPEMRITLNIFHRVTHFRLKLHAMRCHSTISFRAISRLLFEKKDRWVQRWRDARRLSVLDSFVRRCDRRSCWMHSCGVRTLMNPISVAFSRKHWRQMLRPYFLIKPALCVQTRLYFSPSVRFSLSLSHQFSLSILLPPPSRSSLRWFKATHQARAPLP